MKKELEQLLALSLKLGNNLNQIQAAGGNTSFKDDKYLWVKASGFELKHAGPDSFVQCHRDKLESNLRKTYSSDPDISFEEAKVDLLSSMVDRNALLQPSVETSLHVSLQYPFVAHTHPTLVNALTCSPKGKDIVEELFSNVAVFVEYNYPGYALFTRINEESDHFRKKHNQDPQIIFLQNHGIVVSGDSPSEIDSLFEQVFSKIRKLIREELAIKDLDIPKVGLDALPALRMLFSNPKILKAHSTTLSQFFADSTTRFEKVAKPFCFDHVKYNRGAYLYVEPDQDLGNLIPEFEKALDIFRKAEGSDPKIVLIKGLGLIAAGTDNKAAETQLELFEDQMKISYYSGSFGGPVFLGEDEIELIGERVGDLGLGDLGLGTRDLGLGTQGLRKSAPERSRRGELVHDRIAIVTGAAQGFGEGIARDLFIQGANLVIADLNETTSLKLVRELNNPTNSNKAIFIKVDVSDPESVENLISDTVKEFGGLDLMISNAGVLFAGGLDEMEPDTFDFVTRVNYKGYFLCAKYASAVMKLQSKYKPDHFTDIIQINSKSGLKGSNKNFAYAGGKFGGIGLTQSFAMELMPYNIKVNAVCPGNLFDGPLWSDPKNGLFVQYLNAGKVPGAKTIADVKRFYEAQVPANRGCTVNDVMKAIYYIIDQEYETGQAVPVTGGQNMLK
ncbi:MAG: SDR family NAD(P)-dependent oxidoreductase [Bacteroidota bacterium]|nr:SDR family NAD(P)-dependent oxidoreductase [Bacteroidota bacterium]